MIADLLFKGKSLDEALGKASNFFGVAKDIIKYEFDEEAPQSEVWIILTENPIMAQRKAAVDPDSIGNSLAGHTTMSSQAKAPNRRRPQVPRNADRERRPEARERSRPRRDNGGSRPNNRRDSGSKNYRQDSRPVNNSRPSTTHDANWTPKEPDTSVLNPLEKEAFEFLSGIIEKMPVQVEVHPSRVNDKLIFDISGPDRGILLQQKGESLISLQYLTNKIFLRRDEEQSPVYIDSRGYRSSRDQELKDIALTSAERVKSTGKEYNLNPMNPYERRMIHITLKDIEGIATVSRGDGYIKKVSIVPAK